MTKTKPTRLPPATIDFNALHDALGEGKTMEEAKAIATGEVTAVKTKAKPAPSPAPATAAPADDAGSVD